MEAIQNINLTCLLDTPVSLATAFVLGALVGFERQYRQRTAGHRTNGYQLLHRAVRDPRPTKRGSNYTLPGTLSP